MYYYIPQHSWGLVDEAGSRVTGFYSTEGAGCRPVALWCEKTKRGAFSHWDGNGLTKRILHWLSDHHHHEITVYVPLGTLDIAEGMADSFNDFALKGQEDTSSHVRWNFSFAANNIGFVGSKSLNGNCIRYPESWDKYWANAPDWSKGTSTFISDVIPALNGFVANYNGHYYFDFGE